MASAPESLLDSVSAYTGLVPAFQEAGFFEVARRSEIRPLMRYIVARKI